MACPLIVICLRRRLAAPAAEVASVLPVCLRAGAAVGGTEPR